ncbi:hypothetical protein MNBD_GAMMA13-194, partial [hydrothermal vent metagenome]
MVLYDKNHGVTLKCKRVIERAVCYGFVLCCCLPFSLNAETRLFKAYDYDPAGNIVGVETEISENSPQVS